MANKQINARVALKHDIEENWITAGEHGFCPMAGEVIVYDLDATHDYIRYKIGKYTDATKTTLTNINDLKFESNIIIDDVPPQYPIIGMLWLDTSDSAESLGLTYNIGEVVF